MIVLYILKNFISKIICLFLGHVQGKPVILMMKGLCGWQCSRCKTKILVSQNIFRGGDLKVPLRSKGLY